MSPTLSHTHLHFPPLFLPNSYSTLSLCLLHLYFFFSLPTKLFLLHSVTHSHLHYPPLPPTQHSCTPLTHSTHLPSHPPTEPAGLHHGHPGLPLLAPEWTESLLRGQRRLLSPVLGHSPPVQCHPELHLCLPHPLHPGHGWADLPTWVYIGFIGVDGCIGV